MAMWASLMGCLMPAVQPSMGQHCWQHAFDYMPNCANTPFCCCPLQEQIRVLTQRKVELAAAEEVAKAPPEEQKEVRQTGAACFT